jgi:hypothetical protein
MLRRVRILTAALLLGTGMLGAASAAPEESSACRKVREGIGMISRATLVNHAMLLKAVELLHRAQSEAEKAQARKVLESMNLRTADRAPNSELPGLSAELEEAYRVNCGVFGSEENRTLNGLVNRSRQYNVVLARELGDELSRSKVE